MIQYGPMEHDRRVRAGGAAAALAEKRRNKEAIDSASRAQLTDYWNRQKTALNAIKNHHERYNESDQRAHSSLYNRDKQSKLEERQNKLSMMLYYEDLQYKEELKMHSMQTKMMRNTSYLNNVPTEVLKDINLGIKAKEDERQKKEADLRLYHKWRSDNPIIKNLEEKQRNGALKSAWMEQVIEKELAKKKEEEDLQKTLKQRNDYINKQLEIEKEQEKYKEHKMKELQDDLYLQINKLQEAEKVNEDIQSREEVERNLLSALEVAKEMRKKEASTRVAAQEVVLSNMHSYARKIKERAKQAEEDVTADLNELNSLIAIFEKDIHKEDYDKKTWKEALLSAREDFQRQRQIEEIRQKQLEGAMDGEARALYQKQYKIWLQEHIARQELLNDVIETLNDQMKVKIGERRELRKNNITERENMLSDMEKLGEELEKIQTEQKNQKQGFTKMAVLQNQLKQIEREEKELVDNKTHEDELKAAIREEERLRNEIIKLQRNGSTFQLHRRRRMDW